ncbi:MAG TPA: type III pantothenate kinase, partial [Gammaproteobacteria bacterium]|nr:type III pantothenate kinase [Gammaproteobacteria bacterium]
RHGYPVIVVDVGTALTVEVVDGEGRLWGGPVLPGPSAAERALRGSADLLGSRSAAEEAPYLADSTGGGLAAGIQWGYPALIEGLIDRARSALSQPAPAILTGGGAAGLKGWCAGVTERDPLLTLRGIASIAADTALPS